MLSLFESRPCCQKSCLTTLTWQDFIVVFCPRLPCVPMKASSDINFGLLLTNKLSIGVILIQFKQTIHCFLDNSQTFPTIY